VKQGVPFDVAFALYPEEAMGWSVIFGEIDGGTFDWGNMSWVREN
jgi:hypothetical protein